MAALAMQVRQLCLHVEVCKHCCMIGPMRHTSGIFAGSLVDDWPAGPGRLYPSPAVYAGRVTGGEHTSILQMMVWYAYCISSGGMLCM